MNGRMPPGFYLIIAAQFASALADNALLIVTIALLSEQGLPLWWAPLLKFVFTISYVVLAVFGRAVFLPNMRKKDQSLSRYPGFAAYRERSGLLLPRLLG
jgi:hypothetical protein